MFNNSFMNQQNPMNNPMFAQVMQMTQGKTPDQLKQMALDMCKQKGMTQQDMDRFFGQFGIKL